MKKVRMRNPMNIFEFFNKYINDSYAIVEKMYLLPRTFLDRFWGALAREIVPETEFLSITEMNKCCPNSSS